MHISMSIKKNTQNTFLRTIEHSKIILKLKKNVFVSLKNMD